MCASMRSPNPSRHRPPPPPPPPFTPPPVPALFEAMSKAALMNPDPPEPGEEEGDDELIYDQAGLDLAGCTAEQVRAFFFFCGGDVCISVCVGRLCLCMCMQALCEDGTCVCASLSPLPFPPTRHIDTNHERQAAILGRLDTLLSLAPGLGAAAAAAGGAAQQGQFDDADEEGEVEGQGANGHAAAAEEEEEGEDEPSQ